MLLAPTLSLSVTMLPLSALSPYCGRFSSSSCKFFFPHRPHKKILKENDAGDRIPTLAICLDFELPPVIISKAHIKELTEGEHPVVWSG